MFVRQVIVLSFLLVFFGIRSYREQSGGTITFGRAFTVGILITLISCVFYIATWQLIYFKLQPDFMDKWEAYTVEKIRAEGGTPEKTAAARRQRQSFKRAYDNPLTNGAYTFIEPFPVGLVVTVVSAAVLRRMTAAPGSPTSSRWPGRPPSNVWPNTSN